MKEKNQDADRRDVQIEAAVNAALAVMEAHITALNARDETALNATLHFPHYRLSGGKLKVWQQPGEYLADFRARTCLLYTSPSPRDLSTSRMPSSA